MRNETIMLTFEISSLDSELAPADINGTVQTVFTVFWSNSRKNPPGSNLALTGDKL